MVIRGLRALSCAIAAILATSVQASSAGSANQSGIWTLSVDQTAKACRVNLRADPVGAGWGLAMPPGCRRVLPDLNPVQSWSMPSDEQVSFDDAAGQPVLVFGTQNEAGLHAVDAAGQAITLAPYHRASAEEGIPQPIVTALTQATPETPAAIPVSPVGPTRVAVAAKPKAVARQEVAGRYAVLRGTRDTGCMVTLDASAPGPKNTLKARLAPACRDQGIIIFDPLGWQLDAGNLVLTARKGHTLQMTRTPDGVWVKAPPDEKSLGLKPL